MKRLVVATGVLVTVIVAMGAVGLATTTSPRPLGVLADLKREQVIFVDEFDLFLVYNNGRPLALDADAQHLGDDVIYCKSSQLFESPAHGEKFDSVGNHLGGPGSRGLDRYLVDVRDGNVYVDLEYVTPGPERGSVLPGRPQGPLCVPT